MLLRFIRDWTLYSVKKDTFVFCIYWAVFLSLLNFLRSKLIFFNNDYTIHTCCKFIRIHWPFFLAKKTANDKWKMEMFKSLWLYLGMTVTKFWLPWHSSRKIMILFHFIDIILMVNFPTFSKHELTYSNSPNSSVIFYSIVLLIKHWLSFSCLRLRFERAKFNVSISQKWKFHHNSMNSMHRTTSWKPIKTDKFNKLWVDCCGCTCSCRSSIQS